jgi:hypothetical protein
VNSWIALFVVLATLSSTCLLFCAAANWGYANGKENCANHSEKIAGFALSHMVLLYL